jgi:hypothetical protein
VSPDNFVCPAVRHDNPKGPVGERVICHLEKPPPGVLSFVCWGCLANILNAKARREEWQVADAEAVA